jgi:hypothetical protein
MSNFLAIATVTAALGDLLRTAIGTGEPGSVPGAVVTTHRPDDPQNGSTQAGVNIYLYQITSNAALRNHDLPTRDSSGIAVQQPQAAIDLHYLLTFYGNDAKLEPQRLLGLVTRTLHSRSLLTRETIGNFIGAINSGDPYEDLETSDLADSIELVKFSPSMLNLEELSKLWSVFFQTPYTLSVAYQASVVLIEGIETPRTTLPVRERSVYGTSVQRPVIEKLLSQKPVSGAEMLENAPIVVDDILILRGKRLHGDQTIIRFDDAEITSDKLLEFSNTQIQLKLASPPIPEEALLVGKHTVQVVHVFNFEGAPGEQPIPHKVLESNSVTFILRPSIIIEV